MRPTPLLALPTPPAAAVRRRLLLATVLLGASLPGADVLADACPDALAPGASAIDSDVDCDSRVETLARVIDSSVTSGAPFPSPADGSFVGERSLVNASTLTNATLGADTSLVGATLGQFELPVTLGAGSVVGPRARLLATDIGANARIGAGARVDGGRGVDFQTIGDDLVVGAGADIGIRTLGNGAVLGEDSKIGRSTAAGEAFRFGARSNWVVGGDIGDAVTIGDDVTIDGGFSAGDGVVIGNDVTIDTRVRLGPFVQIFREASLASQVDIAANALVGLAVSVGTGTIVGERVLIKRRAVIGVGANLGEGAIVDAGAVVPDGTVVPPFHRVDVAGGITPIEP